MIHDQIQAYRIAVESRTKTQVYCDTADATYDEVRSCLEEEQLRLDGLKSVIGMVLQDYATRQPFNPFSINGDVNQPPVEPQSRLAQALNDDPQIRTIHNGPPPREDI
tara:strand:- start:10544 stop:10867 length:324 start_codon:yes stop_codon:yes gene_type:complete